MEELIKELSNALFGTDIHDATVQNAIQYETKFSEADLKRAIKFINENESNNPHTSISFVVNGEPPASKRPRATNIMKDGKSAGIRMYAADGGAQTTLKNEIQCQLPAEHIPFEGEVELHLTIFKPMLSWPPYRRMLAELGYLRPEVKPDYDNYSKIITDAMRAIVFKDDSQVVVGNVSLYYSHKPRLEVVVSGRRGRMTK